MLLNEIFSKKKSVSVLEQMNQLIAEADRPDPKRTAFKDPKAVDLDSIFGPGKTSSPIVPSSNRAPNADQPQKGNATKTRAGSAKTRQAASGVNVDDRSAELLAQLHASGMKDDREIEPKTPGTDVAIKGNDVANRSTELSLDGVEPEWHNVKDLPGYMSSAIRAMGRQIFAPLTLTDIEDIDVLANVNGSGPNSDEEIRQVGAYLRRKATRNTEAELDFNQSVLRGYKADIQIWVDGSTEYLTVKDHAGHYIYSWPLSDSKSFDLFKSGVAPGLSQDRTRLK